MAYYEENGCNIIDKYVIYLSLSDAIKFEHDDEVGMLPLSKINSECYFMTYIVFNQTNGVTDHYMCYLQGQLAYVELLIIRNMDSLVMICRCTQIPLLDIADRAIVILNTVLVGLSLSLKSLFPKWFLYIFHKPIMI